jgi:HlyD family secretion protein
MTAAPAPAPVAAPDKAVAPPVRKPARLRLWLALAAGGVVLAGLGWWLTHRAPPVAYVTAPVTRGDVATTITASGSVNPEVTVQVGAFVSGTIQSLSCDYNTRVRTGQLCANIDPKPYQVIVDQDVANLAAARAQLVKDQADLAYARLNLARADRLLKQDSISHDADDIDRNARDQALALVGVDQALIDQKASLLKAARINLAYTDIVSPVDGTVVSRNVNVGQTVASSFTTPTLFLIARDLTRMQVDTNVSESDIAGAVQGAPATFTVDAFPGRTFTGKVTQVRQAPISVQNVITYDVVVAVANPDFALKPGMTATARVVRAQATGVLRVPSQALRFTPAGKAAVRTGQGQTGQGRTGGGGKGKGAGQRTVWVVKDGKPTAVRVVVGLDDDTFAQIKSGALAEGDLVAIGQTGGAAAMAKARPATTPRL